MKTLIVLVLSLPILLYGQTVKVYKNGEIIMAIITATDNKRLHTDKGDYLYSELDSIAPGDEKTPKWDLNEILTRIGKQRKVVIYEPNFVFVESSKFNIPSSNAETLYFEEIVSTAIPTNELRLLASDFIIQFKNISRGENIFSAMNEIKAKSELHGTQYNDLYSLTYKITIECMDGKFRYRISDILATLDYNKQVYNPAYIFLKSNRKQPQMRKQYEAINEIMFNELRRIGLELKSAMGGYFKAELK